MALPVWPKYASNVYFGLVQDTATGAFYVETLHDEKPSRMMGCSGFPCPWAEFVNIAQKSFVANRAAVCQTRKRAILLDPVAQFLC
jgi:hypothetical protein